MMVALIQNASHAQLAKCALELVWFQEMHVKKVIIVLRALSDRSLVRLEDLQFLLVQDLNLNVPRVYLVHIVVHGVFLLLQELARMVSFADRVLEIQHHPIITGVQLKLTEDVLLEIIVREEIQDPLNVQRELSTQLRDKLSVSSAL